MARIEVKDIQAEQTSGTEWDVTATFAPVEPVMAFFEFGHLKPPMQAISKRFASLAAEICEQIQAGPQRTLALTLLLQAKDAAVRAALKPGG